MQNRKHTHLQVKRLVFAVVVASLLSAPARAETLRVGVYDNAPKLMMGSDGRLSGILGELLQAMADEERWQLIPVSCSWEQCLSLLEQQRIDLLPDVGLTPERSFRFAFHRRPALHSWSQAFSPADGTYTSPLQLDGKRIATLGSSIHQSYIVQLASGFGLSIDVIGVDSFESAFASVLAGEADLAVVNHLYGNFHAERFGLQPTAIVFQPVGLFYAAPRDSGQAILARIDHWLEHWSEDSGSPFYKVMQRWGAYVPERGQAARSHWGAIILGAMLLAAIAVAFRLTRQVKHRSAALAESRFRLSEMLNFDSVTRLPNRHQLLERLRTSMMSAQRGKRDGAILHIDLDNFRDLNDSHGHATGDLLLRAVADRLNDLPIRHFMPARVYGDAFILLIESLSGDKKVAQAEVEQATQATQAALQKTFRLEDTEYRGSACIGVVMFSDVGYQAAELLKSAELAMYDAKAAGRNSLRFFNQEMQQQVLQRTELESAIHRALDNGEFALWYQPQYDEQGRVLGLEALLRWEDPVNGIIMPGKFIPAAETSGLILQLGHQIFSSACQQLADWAGHPALGGVSIAVNISARQLHDDDFVDNILAILDATGADANLLELELTETLLVKNVEDAIVKMQRLRKRGVRFALDDFGTGYSSMNYLKRLPLEKLKIDQSFVRDLLTDPNDAAIVRTIVALGQSLGLVVIAEGVETEAQRDMLLASGCSRFQGYFFGYPLPADELRAGLEANL